MIERPSHTKRDRKGNIKAGHKQTQKLEGRVVHRESGRESLISD